MLRRMAIGGTTAAMFLVLLAGCGGSSATSSPSAEASTAAETGAPTSAPASQAAQASPSVSATAASQKVAACAGVGVRKTPGSAGVVLVRLGKGTVVRAVGTVTGDHYDATTCGTSGQEWLKVDRINGKSVKSLYGVTWGYAAAGFFK